MTRTWKIFTLVIVSVLMLGIFVSAFNGNPLTKIFVTIQAKRYIAQTYGDTDFEVEKVELHDKDPHRYLAYIVSPGSVDSHFIVSFDRWGKIEHDGYPNRVPSGLNMADRLKVEYRDRVEDVVTSPTFPYRVTTVSATISFVSKGTSRVPKYALIANDLTLDASFDADFGAKAGELHITITDDTVSAERLAEILLDLKQILDNEGVPFYVITCNLADPDPATWKDGGRLQLIHFLSSDIYEQGMVERVREASEFS